MKQRKIGKWKRQKSVVVVKPLMTVMTEYALIGFNTGERLPS
jgi:hypothetical protein